MQSCFIESKNSRRYHESLYETPGSTPCAVGIAPMFMLMFTLLFL